MTGPVPGASSRLRAIAGAALPLYLTMAASSAAAVVDTVLLGRHATASLAAFAVTIAVHSPATAAVTGVMRGVMPFVAQHREDPGKLAGLVRQGRRLGLVVGGLGALVVGALPLYAARVGVPPATVRAFGLLPLLLALAVLSTAVGASAVSVLVALGESTAVMRAGLVGTVCAPALSVVLIPGYGPVPALGSGGAGIAMLTSSLVTALCAQRALHRVELTRGVRPVPDAGQPAGILALARVGLPLAGTVLVKFAVLGVLTFAAARLGTGQAAVHGVLETLVNLVYTAAVAVGQATVPVVARAVRAGDVSDSRRSVLAGAGVAVCAVGGLGLALLAGGHWIAAAFSGDPAVRALIADQLPLVALVVMTDALQAVFGFGMLGLKRTLPSLMTTAVFFGGLSLVAVPVADAGGLTALWSALALANLLQAAAKAWLFHRQSALIPAPEGAPAPVG